MRSSDVRETFCRSTDKSRSPLGFLSARNSSNEMAGPFLPAVRFSSPFSAGLFFVTIHSPPRPQLMLRPECYDETLLSWNRRRLGKVDHTGTLAGAVARLLRRARPN